MTATAPTPRGLARADQATAAAHAQTVANQAALRAAQNQHGAAIRLRKLARTDRTVADLLDAHTALQAKHTALASQHYNLCLENESLAGQRDELERKFAQAAEETLALRERLVVREQELATAATELKAALKPKR